MIISSEYKYNLDWQKCPLGKWHNLLELPLGDNFLIGLEGIFVVWHGGQQPAVICVGQGNIKEELSGLQKNPEILQHKEKGIFVSWAEVCFAYREGARRYLMNLWQPEFKDVSFGFLPIKVNLPWE